MSLLNCAPARGGALAASLRLFGGGQNEAAAAVASNAAGLLAQQKEGVARAGLGLAAVPWRRRGGGRGGRRGGRREALGHPAKQIGVLDNTFC